MKSNLPLGYKKIPCQLSNMFGSEKITLLNKVIKAVVDYQAYVITPEILLQLINEKKGQSSSGTSLLTESLLIQIGTYVDSFFIMVHSGFDLISEDQISDYYFSFLNQLGDFFVFLKKEAPHDFNNQVKDKAVKVILTLERWGDLVEKKSGENGKGDIYRHLGKKHFSDLFAKNFGSYDEFKNFSYQGLAELTHSPSLKEIFLGCCFSIKSPKELSVAKSAPYTLFGAASRMEESSALLLKSHRA